jgi:hypothetical protein
VPKFASKQVILWWLCKEDQHTGSSYCIRNTCCCKGLGVAKSALPVCAEA